MKSTAAIFLIVAAQLVVDLFMWYFAIENPFKYQGYWAALLGINIILVSLVMLVILRYYIKRSETYG